MDDPAALAAEHEALLQFLYMAPTGIVQFDAAGEVSMMNPTAAQLLLSAVPDDDLANLFATLATAAPDLRERVARFERRSGPVFEDFRIEFPRGTDPKQSLVLALSVIRMDPSRHMAIVNDVSELVRRERELREKEAWHRESLERALVAAQAADNAKSEFLTNISHELRTPMHAISSFARLGHDRSLAAPREKLVQYFRNIDSSAGRLGRLLNDLLDLAKIEAGKMDYQFATYDLTALIRAVLVEFDGLAANRGLVLALEANGPLPQVRVDEVRMKQVVANLVSNAVKFSPECGRVTVYANAEGETISVAVLDEGPGIPAEELESVFDKFVQSSITKTGAGGTGLGLPISREIVRAHGGTLVARNREGRGTEFLLRLPIATSAPSLAAVAASA